MQPNTEAAAIAAKLADRACPPDQRVRVLPLQTFVGSFRVLDASEADEANETIKWQPDGSAGSKVVVFTKRIVGTCPVERMMTQREIAAMKAGNLPERIKPLPAPVSSNPYHRGTEAGPPMCRVEPLPENAAPAVPWWLALSLIERGLGVPLDDAEAKKLAALERAHAKAAA